ncbi:MAG: PTS sugar transporter subunit IIB [Bacillota bacterium]
MKTIIVACGGGIATSATVASKINSRLEDLGLSGKAKVEAVDIKSLEMFISTSDLYVSITPMAKGQQEYAIPTISGIPFLTGMGADETMEKIVEMLKLK